MKLLRPLVVLSLRRPHRIPAIVGMGWAFRARGWYRRFPFIPWPSAQYVRWRMETAWGSAEAEPEQDELERFVVWSARMRALM